MKGSKSNLVAVGDRVEVVSISSELRVSLHYGQRGSVVVILDEHLVTVTLDDEARSSRSYFDDELRVLDAVERLAELV